MGTVEGLILLIVYNNIFQNNHLSPNVKFYFKIFNKISVFCCLLVYYFSQ